MLKNKEVNKYIIDSRKKGTYNLYKYKSRKDPIISVTKVSGIKCRIDAKLLLF